MPVVGTEPAAVAAGSVRPARSRRGGRWWSRIVLTVLCAAWLVPSAGTIVTSFRTSDGANSTGWWTVLASPLAADQFTLDNYQQVWNGGVARSFLTSMVVTVPAVAIPTVVAAMAAYAFAFMSFPGRTILFATIVALLVVPIQVALAPLLRLYSDVGLNGTYPAAYLAHAGFGLPLAVLLLRNYMLSLPRAMIEAARVDGASHYQTFWRLVVPLSVPALAAFSVFQFLAVWNDLLVALVFLGEGDRQTVTITLNGQIGQVGGQGWQSVSGTAMIVIVVPVVVFLLLQRYFVRGLVTGAVGG